MAQSPFSRKTIRGFTLTEVAVALFVLAIGLSSVAALLASTTKSTSATEYMTQAATLASEKLEDLNRFQADGGGGGDPNICVPSGTTAGSITADTSASVTCNSTTAVNIDYFDEIFMSPTAGSLSETVSGLDGSGNVQYTTTAQQPNGTVVMSQSSSRTALTAGAIYFKRRWVIELNPTINGVTMNGVRRITVYVFLENLSVAPDVSFQMSLVRP
ncbi:MAG: prepilin-type N-terminal cleavage/methylation domain-containing protein [Candidatus Acidiferrales bacterium]